MQIRITANSIKELNLKTDLAIWLYGYDATIEDIVNNAVTAMWN